MNTSRPPDGSNLSRQIKYVQCCHVSALGKVTQQPRPCFCHAGSLPVARVLVCWWCLIGTLDQFTENRINVAKPGNTDEMASVSLSLSLSRSCICVGGFVCVRVCVRACVRMCVRACVRVCMRMQVRGSVSQWVCEWVHPFVCLSTCTNAHTHTRVVKAKICYGRRLSGISLVDHYIILICVLCKAYR